MRLRGSNHVKNEYLKSVICLKRRYFRTDLENSVFIWDRLLFFTFRVEEKIPYVIVFVW